MKIRRIIVVLLSMGLALGSFGAPAKAVSASVVTSRLQKVRKEFPNKRRINQKVLTNTFHVYQGNEYPGAWNGGCDALVSYTTLKIFHNAFQAGAKSYTKVGSASTKSKSKMSRLFQKAKAGDVVYWSKGKKERHAAIYLKRSSKGIYVYEANFGSKNKIYYNHLWKYGNMKSWSHGATTVGIYRSKNYKKVNQKKAAKKLSKGSVFTVNGVTYKVISNEYKCGKVKVVRKESYARAAKYVGLNYETATMQKRYLDEYYFENYTSQYIRQTAYMTALNTKKTLCDEQLFRVVK